MVRRERVKRNSGPHDDVNNDVNKKSNCPQTDT